MQSYAGYLGSVPHWIRQSEKARETSIERVYHISKISPGQEPLVIASCGKAAAQRFLAAVATQHGPEQYRISACFDQPLLFAGMER